ncbi:MAG TPA: hypothetical protein VGK29_13615 [Paludibaculum sp.]|jgi:uncharacterized protein (TIGR03437 family)
MRNSKYPISTLVLALMAMLPLAAQMTVGVRFQATFPAAEFYVDGARHSGQAAFFWPAGTKHLVEVRQPRQLDGSGTTSLKFKGFEENTTLLAPVESPIQQITVTASVTAYKLIFVREYRVDLYLNYDSLDNWQLGLRDNLGCTFENPYINKTGFVQASVPLPGLVCGNSVVSSGSARGVAFGATLDPTGGAGWVEEGTTIALNAFSYPGYVFKGWDLPNSAGKSFLTSLTITGPTVIRALFEMGRRHHIRSAPEVGLKVLVDRTLMPTSNANGRCYAASSEPNDYPAPDNPAPPTSPENPTLAPYGPGMLVPLCDGDRDFLPGTQVLLAAPTSQTTNTGKIWIFNQWDLGDGRTGGQNTSWTVPDDWSPQTLTAQFVPGLRASFVTLPTGLKLKIDGRENWPSLNFEWGIGHKHNVEAPTEQLDSRGRRYRFVGWSNGGPAAQEVTIVEDPVTPNSFRMIARYELLGQLNLTSDPPSMPATLGGVECKTPCTLDRVAGTEVSVAVAPELALSPDTKVIFDGWTDGSQALSRIVTLGADQIALRAKYRYLQHLRMISDPEGGAAWEFSPAPEAGTYFPLGTRVEVTAVAQPGHKFRRWEGALSGPYHTGWVTMNTPQTIVARLDKVPALSENAVRNAAGVTPENIVAPGSLISIRGYNLAPGSQTGPASPLTQTLQGVVVQINSRILPLVSVAPEEIIAQLPSDFVEGEYTVTIRSTGQAPLFGKCQVARNAPGLFRAPESIDDTPMAMAFHENGHPVTVANPAQTGETVSILGTGFGPVEPSPLDGFAVPAAPPLALRDTLEVVAGGETRPHVWAGAAPGRVGYSLFKLQVDATMGQAQNLELKVRINGRESNPVLLPLQ